MEKIEVTDEMVYLGVEKYRKTLEIENYYFGAMKAALEAVFEHLANNKEKPNSSIFDEPPLLDKCEHKRISRPYCHDCGMNIEETKPEKKQTLMEYATTEWDFQAGKSGNAFQILETISNYLENN